MGFQFSPYESNLTGTITDLISQRGRDQAQGVLASGQAQAAGAAGVGKALSVGADQMMQYQLGAPKREAEQLELTKMKRTESDTTGLRDLIKNTPKVDLGDGVMGWDIDAISSAAAQRGLDPTMAEKELAPLNQSLQAAYQAKVGVVRSGADALQRAGNDPALAHDFLDVLEKNKSIFSADQIQHYRDIIDNEGQAGVAKITAALGTPPSVEFAPAGSQPMNKNTGLPTGPAIAPRPQRPIMAPDGSLLDPLDGHVISDGHAKADKPGEWEGYLNAYAKDHGIDPKAMNSQQILSARTAWATAERKPDDEVTRADKELPKGVADFIVGLTQEKDKNGAPLSFDAAKTKLVATMPDLRKDHPNLSDEKAIDLLRKAYGPDPAKPNPVERALALILGDKTDAADTTQAPGASGARPPAAPPVAPPAGAPPAAPPAGAPAAPAAAKPAATPLKPGDSVMVSGKQVAVSAKPEIGKIIALKDGRYLLVKTVNGDKFDGDILTSSAK